MSFIYIDGSRDDWPQMIPPEQYDYRYPPLRDAPLPPSDSSLPRRFRWRAAEGSKFPSGAEGFGLLVQGDVYAIHDSVLYKTELECDGYLLEITEWIDPEPTP